MKKIICVVFGLILGLGLSGGGAMAAHGSGHDRPTHHFAPRSAASLEVAYDGVPMGVTATAVESGFTGVSMTKVADYTDNSSVRHQTRSYYGADVLGQLYFQVQYYKNANGNWISQAKSLNDGIKVVESQVVS